MEAFRWLVPLPVFNTGVTRHPGQAGSIPVRLRQPPCAKPPQLSTVRPADLAAEAWIVGEGAKGDPQFGAWPTLKDPQIAFAVRSWPTRFGLVAAGLGISVVPQLAAPTVPAGVRTLAVADTGWPGRQAVVVTPPGRSARALAMVQAITAESARLHREVCSERQR